MNEAEIEAKHIDPARKATGWGLVEGNHLISATRAFTSGVGYLRSIAASCAGIQISGMW